jgi:hypothetical protein
VTRKTAHGGKPASPVLDEPAVPEPARDR